MATRYAAKPTGRLGPHPVTTGGAGSPIRVTPLTASAALLRRVRKPATNSGAIHGMAASVRCERSASQSQDDAPACATDLVFPPSRSRPSSGPAYLRRRCEPRTSQRRCSPQRARTQVARTAQQDADSRVHTGPDAHDEPIGATTSKVTPDSVSRSATAPAELNLSLSASGNRTDLGENPGQ